MLQTLKERPKISVYLVFANLDRSTIFEHEKRPQAANFGSNFRFFQRSKLGKFDVLLPNHELRTYPFIKVCMSRRSARQWVAIP